MVERGREQGISEAIQYIKDQGTIDVGRAEDVYFIVDSDIKELEKLKEKP